MSQDVGKLRCWIAQVPLYISKYFIINFTFSSITTLTVYIHPQFETRYDYNLTIMKSPKPATDNRFKK
jgi:hypothetical protein